MTQEDLDIQNAKTCRDLGQITPEEANRVFLDATGRKLRILTPEL